MTDEQLITGIRLMTGGFGLWMSVYSFRTFLRVNRGMFMALCLIWLAFGITFLVLA